MLKKMKALFVEEEGQGMTEYGLVLGIIAVAVVGILALMRGQIVSMFQSVESSLSGQSTGSGSGTTTTP